MPAKDRKAKKAAGKSDKPEKKEVAEGKRICFGSLNSESLIF